MNITIDSDAENHQYDANNALLLSAVLILCLLISYLIKLYHLYFLPESAAAVLVGMVIGGVTRFFSSSDDTLELLSFSPELFFFVLLPPIIFEAGYTLKRKHFFANIVPIVAYAFAGTLVSTFIVGGLVFAVGKMGLTSNVDTSNPLEALLFGALISAVDPVATLSIMGSPELKCDQLLYSLVFGESVLNDAVAIVLFKTFRKYYDGDEALTSGNIPGALFTFVLVSLGSILVGIVLGLGTSGLLKHTTIRDFPKFETALLFLFCFGCYATAEAIGMSGIMALFFNGIVLSHYNSYNLSEESNAVAEHIFATLATVSETLVFLYMGLSVFTGSFKQFDPFLTFLILVFCVIARACHIFPLSYMVNLCRNDRNKIPKNMQTVIWFVGLRGAIAFALSENMPGPNKSSYIANTLCVCIFTTVVCGGVTEKILTKYGMKREGADVELSHNFDPKICLVDTNLRRSNSISERVRFSFRDNFKKFDNVYLKPLFGGATGDGVDGEVCDESELQRWLDVKENPGVGEVVGGGGFR